MKCSDNIITADNITQRRSALVVGMDRQASVKLVSEEEI